MTMTLGRECRMLLLGCLMMAATGTAAHAQGPGGLGGPGGGPGGGMGMPGGSGRMGGGMGGMRGGRHGGGSAPSTGMSGRWWDNKGMAKSLGLNGDQQKRMDHVFTQNRDTLQQRYDAFVKQQAKLDAMKRSNTASESELFTEIQRTASARAELEQAYTHMQLQIKGELTPEQAKTLESQK